MEERHTRCGEAIRQKKLALKARFLRCSLIRKIKEDRIEQARVHAGGIPASVKIAGELLGRDEASIDVQYLATSSR